MLVTIINGDANKRTLPTPFYIKQIKGYLHEYTMVDDDGNVNTITIAPDDKSYLQISTRKLKSCNLIVAPYAHNLVQESNFLEFNDVVIKAQAKLHRFLTRINKAKYESAH